MSNSRLYDIWSNMLRRAGVYGCQERDPGYEHVTVCDDWRTFSKFMEWSLANGYTNVSTIDRINNGLGYGPDNCRWTDIVTQRRNTSRTKLSKEAAIKIRVSFMGGTRRRELCEAFGVTSGAIGAVIRNETWKDAIPVMADDDDSDEDEDDIQPNLPHPTAKT